MAEMLERQPIEVQSMLLRDLGGRSVETANWPTCWLGAQAASQMLLALEDANAFVVSP